MGSAAYEASKKAMVCFERVTLPNKPNPEAGRGVIRIRFRMEPKAPLDKVQSGRVVKKIIFKPINSPSEPVNGDQASSKKEALASNNAAPCQFVSDFGNTKLQRSAARGNPSNGCLKKPLPKGEYEPAGKSVRFEDQATVRVVQDPTLNNRYYHFRHGEDPTCYCKECKRKGPLDRSNSTNTITIEILAVRLRSGISQEEDTVELDKSHLLAQFNKHRMLGEALQGPHKYFLTDLFLSDKSKAARTAYQTKYDAEESALEMMRHKRRKDTFFKICQREWDWLDLDDLAPEVRSSEPRTELDVHWETVEDSQMKGFSLDRKSNLKRTRKEVQATEENKPERTRLPDSARAVIEVPQSILSLDMSLDDELPVEKVTSRPSIRDVWV